MRTVEDAQPVAVPSNALEHASDHRHVVPDAGGVDAVRVPAQQAGGFDHVDSVEGSLVGFVVGHERRDLVYSAARCP